jgi:ribosomal protein L7/L12
MGVCINADGLVALTKLVIRIVKLASGPGLHTIECIKELRYITGLGPFETKELVEAARQTILLQLLPDGLGVSKKLKRNHVV